MKDTESLHPWKYTQHSFPNPIPGSSFLHTKKLRITFLETGPKPDSVPVVAAVIVPKGREPDHLFCTQEGHISLMNKFYGISRLFLVANKVDIDIYSDFLLSDVDVEDEKAVQSAVNGLLFPLHPRDSGSETTKFLTYKDDIVCRIVRSRARIYPTNLHDVVLDIDKPMMIMKELNFELDFSEIVDTTSMVMLYGLAMVSSSLKSKSVLCIGVIGGFLMNFLAINFEFKVVCVDDDVILVPQYRENFGISLFSQIMQHVSPTLMIEEVNDPGTNKGDHYDALRSRGLVSYKYDALIINMNEFEYGTRTGLTAPPREMIALDMVRKMKAFLYDHGAMLVHVIAPDSVFYLDFLQNLKEVLFKVYKIDLDNDTERGRRSYRRSSEKDEESARHESCEQRRLEVDRSLTGAAPEMAALVFLPSTHTHTVCELHFNRLTKGGARVAGYRVGRKLRRVKERIRALIAGSNLMGARVYGFHPVPAHLGAHMSQVGDRGIDISYQSPG
ncbi:hypothetical protein E3N88_02996 [Mikania micrantha]|uniref:Uncharacterized protein n=1 Tax=Mikania micrantha TaxID=192012 RepID=A0A5N6Q843_9ASTR|nr:hypothetical protein E3N88_02996 [Mikania micrantha]